MRRTILVVLVLATLGWSSSPAAAMETEDEKDARETVEHFLELLGGLRFYALGQYFTEGANIITARSTRSGFTHRVVGAREWLDDLMAGPASQPFRETLDNVEVSVESGELALVRGDFEIVRGDRVESHGVDFFTLLRQDAGWKIASIAYTSIPNREPRAPTSSEVSEAPTELGERLKEQLDAFDAESSLHAKHLPTGREVEVRADEPRNALSVIKIPIMVLAFRDAEAGRLDLGARYRIRPEDRRRGSGLLQTFERGLEPTFRDLVTQMIVTSDNTATDILITRLGLPRVNRLLEERGYETTRLRTTTGDLFRRVWEMQDPDNASLSHAEVYEKGFPEDEQARARSFDFEGNPDEWLGSTTAREMSRLLEEIYSSKLASRESSEAMIEILRRQFYGSRLPRFIRFEVPVAHKTGDWPPIAGNDVGILFHEGGPTIVSVFVNQNRGSFLEVEETIGAIARELVEAWSQ